MFFNKNKRILKILKWMILRGKPIIWYITIITIISSLMSIASVSLAVVSKEVIDSAMAGNLVRLKRTIITFGILILVQLILNAIYAILSVYTDEKSTNNMRLALFQHIIKAEWLQVSHYHSGDILTHMTSDVATVTGGYSKLIPDMISFGVRLVTAFIALLLLQPTLAFIAILIAPIALVFSRIFSRKLARLQKSIQEAEGKYRSYLHEGIQNIQILKVFGLEEYSIEHIKGLQRNRFEFVKKRNMFSVLANTSLMIGYWLAYFITFTFGVFGLSSGALSFGALIALVQLVSQIQSPFMALASALPQLISVVVSAERLMELENINVELETEQVNVCNISGITFDKVSFGYDTEHYAVQNVSCTIKQGEVVGIIGPSGEGKTTMLRLMMSLIHPREGCVYFTDNHYQKIEANASTRALLSYVPQGNVLFSGTIAENIRIGNSDATEEELVEVAKMACAWRFIQQLPHGLHTMIGEKSYGLSEGQAQRISLARALLRKSPVLLLDEITSALDAETEMEILKNIRVLDPPRTCIVITHRPSALEICHRVFRLDQGRLCEVDNTVGFIKVS